MQSPTSNLDFNNLVTYNAEAYRQHENYSPEPIRDALWNLFGSKVYGTVLDAGSGSGGWIKRLQAQSSIDKIISKENLGVTIYLLF
jgi:hypothetical protein